MVPPFNFSAFDRFSQWCLVFQWFWCLEDRQEIIWVCVWVHQDRHLCFTAVACPSLGWHQIQISLRCSYPAAVASWLCKEPWSPTSLWGLRAHILDIHHKMVNASGFGLPFSGKASSWSSCSAKVWRLIVFLLRYKTSPRRMSMFRCGES